MRLESAFTFEYANLARCNSYDTLIALNGNGSNFSRFIIMEFLRANLRNSTSGLFDLANLSQLPSGILLLAGLESYTFGDIPQVMDSVIRDCERENTRIGNQNFYCVFKGRNLILELSITLHG